MHHAYLYEGPQSLLQELAGDARTRFGFDVEHSPDVHVRQFEKFGIDESRWLADLGAFKSASGQALFVLGIASITSEAQQALLKLFEEPQHGHIYVVLVPHGTLLPTLRSRLMEYPKLQTSSTKDQTSSKFLKSSQKERSDFIAKLLKEEDKEKVRDFVNALEAELHKKSMARSDLAIRQALGDISMVRDYLRDRSPSLKMLLEHLGLSLPLL